MLEQPDTTSARHPNTVYYNSRDKRKYNVHKQPPNCTLKDMMDFRLQKQNCVIQNNNSDDDKNSGDGNDNDDDDDDDPKSHPQRSDGSPFTKIKNKK